MGWIDCRMFSSTGSYWILDCLMPLFNHLSRYSCEIDVGLCKLCVGWINHIFNRLGMDPPQPYSWHIQKELCKWEFLSLDALRTIKYLILQLIIEIRMGTCLVLNGYLLQMKSIKQSTVVWSHVPVSVCYSSQVHIWKYMNILCV